MQKQNLCTTEIWWSQKYHSKCLSILFTTLCLKKQRSSNILSMRQLRRIVTNRPAAEKARSASTLNAGIDLRKWIFSISGGNLPVASVATLFLFWTKCFQQGEGYSILTHYAALETILDWTELTELILNWNFQNVKFLEN